MISAYTKFWKNYFRFKGNTTRVDFWTPFVINTIVVAIIRILSLTLIRSGIMLILQMIIGILLIVPSTTLAVRRLRDAGMPLWLGVCFGLSIIDGLLQLSLRGVTLSIVTFPLYILILVMLAFCARPTKIK